VDGLVGPLAAALQARGRLVPPSEGFCQVHSHYRLEAYLDRAKADIANGRRAAGALLPAAGSGLLPGCCTLPAAPAAWCWPLLAAAG
jgi:hypothetical protein